MKKPLLFLLSLIILFGLIGCGSDDKLPPETISLTEREEQLVTAPSLGYIIECLKHVPSIVGIEVDREDNSADFAGMANCTGTIYFISNLVDYEDVTGETVSEKGTAGGGSIDVFSTASEAEERNEYLMGYDDTWLDPGSHVVVGSVVIRISKELNDDQQKELQNNIIQVLTSGEIVEPEIYEASWVAEDANIKVEPIESSTAAEETINATEPTQSAIEATTVPTEAVQPTQEIIETTPVETTKPVDEWDGIKLSASDLTVRTQSDYAHTDTDIFFLGKEEGVTITITVGALGVTEDDFVILYDEALLSVHVEDPTTSGLQTIIELYVTGKTTCETELVICTAYDLITYGDESPAYFFDIRKLNSTEGRLVYVTYSGEKYHFSKNCAGDGAITTTYRDATVYEYEPCGKCAK